MRHLLHCLTLCVVTSIVAPATFAQERISALIVSGANNHDWEWTTPSLESILTESGLFDVRVTYEPSVTLADAAALEDVEVFVLDYNGPDWGEAARAGFLEAVPDSIRSRFSSRVQKFSTCSNLVTTGALSVVIRWLQPSAWKR